MKVLIVISTVSFLLLSISCSSPGIAKEEGEEKAIQSDYGLAYNDGEVLTFHITVPAEGWKEMHVKPFRYVSGTFRFKDEVYENVGIRMKGNSSAMVRGDRKSYKVQFDRNDDKTSFHGIRKLNLHNGFKDPSLMREKLAWDLFRAAGVPASRASHVRLYVTVPGLYGNEYLGLYTSTEQVDEAFLRGRFGNDDGNLFKVEIIGESLAYRGKSPRRYEKGFELKTNRAKKDISDLASFLAVLNETPDNSFKTEIEKVFNVESFLGWLAVNTLLVNMDSYAGMGHNFYLYQNTKTGRFEFIPWDLNEAFGNFKTGSNEEMLNLDIYYPTQDSRVLIDRILDVPEYEEAYRAKLSKLLAGAFLEAKMHGKIDTVYERIKKAVHADGKKECSNKDFDASISENVRTGHPGGRFGGKDVTFGLKPFVSKRIKSVRKQLESKRKKRKKRKNEMVERLLRDFDRNGDGKVSIREFPGPREIFKECDWNADGFLDEKEITNLPPPPKRPFPDFPGKGPR
jgi:spore coat protein CotH